MRLKGLDIDFILHYRKTITQISFGMMFNIQVLGNVSITKQFEMLKGILNVILFDDLK